MTTLIKGATTLKRETVHYKDKTVDIVRLVLRGKTYFVHTERLNECFVFSENIHISTTDLNKANEIFYSLTERRARV